MTHTTYQRIKPTLTWSVNPITCHHTFRQDGYVFRMFPVTTLADGHGYRWKGEILYDCDAVFEIGGHFHEVETAMVKEYVWTDTTVPPTKRKNPTVGEVEAITERQAARIKELEEENASLRDSFEKCDHALKVCYADSHLIRVEHLRENGLEMVARVIENIRKHSGSLAKTRIKHYEHTN